MLTANHYNNDVKQVSNDVKCSLLTMLVIMKQHNEFVIFKMYNV